MLLSTNPTTEEIINETEELTSEEIEQKLAVAHDTYLQWRETSFAHRAERMKRLAELLRKDARKYAEITTREMGRPIKQSLASVEKCAWVCDYYAKEAEEMLKPEMIEADASKSYVRFDPIGIVLAVMPWNYPLWQVMRFIVPAAMAGNVGILKHASNVQMSAQLIEELFDKAGFPQGVFQNLPIGSSKVAGIIEDDRVRAITLTGSEYAGSKVAEVAGKEIKKTVLELGGSDPFIILSDADIPTACEVGTTARLQNAGQSCIAAKRFIVVKDRLEEFLQIYKERYEAMVVGDPMDENTDMGPVVTEKSLEEIQKQVEKSVELGAKVVTGGNRVGDKGYFFAPTILRDVAPGMPAYDDELFGPVASVIVAEDEDDAIRIANDHRYGLGGSLWSEDTEKAEKLAAKIDTGAVFINSMTKSDPRLPFGGVKKSGFGRELSHYGIKEFTNVKTVLVK